VLKQQPIIVRQKAGLRLKNNIKLGWADFHPHVKAYVKQQALSCLGDDNKFVRATVGSIVTTIAFTDGLEQWQGLLQMLAAGLDSSNPNDVDGAFNALSKICEDGAPQRLGETHMLDSEALGRPLNVLIPKFIAQFLNPSVGIRNYALGSVNQFLLCMPQALLASMDAYMQGLFQLTQDPDTEVRKRVCQAFVILLDVRYDYLKAHIENVIQFMLAVTHDKESEAALEACEFWAAYCESHAAAEPQLLHKYLPQIVPVLLQGMIYTENDLALIGFDEEEDGATPDADSDIRPRHHTSSAANGGGGDDEDDDDDDDDDDEWDNQDGAKEWTLRKCSAQSLDKLAHVYKAELVGNVNNILMRCHFRFVQIAC
jgi:hypothetical protein